MLRSLSKSLWLMLFDVVVTCGLYPAILWGVGQTFISFQTNGSTLDVPDGKPVGSLPIAQPFTQDEYFWPYPSAVSYNRTAGTCLGIVGFQLRAERPQRLHAARPSAERFFLFIYTL
jgi:K+-transporting ATPase ATPase C chain